MHEACHYGTQLALCIYPFAKNKGEPVNREPVGRACMVCVRGYRHAFGFGALCLGHLLDSDSPGFVD